MLPIARSVRNPLSVLRSRVLSKPLIAASVYTHTSRASLDFLHKLYLILGYLSAFRFNIFTIINANYLLVYLSLVQLQRE